MSDATDDRPTTQLSSDPPAVASPQPEPAGTTPPGKSQGRAPGGGERRRKRGGAGERRSEPGFADGIERSRCAACHHVLPETFPVQGRTGVAVIRPFVVARWPDAVLLCDGEHAGPHLWPDGTPADDEGEEQGR